MESSTVTSPPNREVLSRRYRASGGAAGRCPAKDLCVLLEFAILAAIDCVTMSSEQINYKLEWLPAEFFRAL